MYNYKEIMRIFQDRAKNPPSPEEAKQDLIDCGIMDENGEIKEAYKDIVVPKETKKNAKS